jgi:hypothetical protein
MASTIYLKDIPDKIMKAISTEQANMKIRTGATLNQSKAVIKMLRDYLRCREQNNFKSETE